MKKQLTFFKLLRDSLFIMLFGGFVTFLFTFVDLSKLEFLNPISNAFSDFELTDIVFSRVKLNASDDPSIKSDDITLVNIGNLDREGIAQLVDTINKYDPAVIGIDARFFSAKSDPADPVRDSVLRAKDSALIRAFSKVKNLVLGCENIEDSVKKLDAKTYEFRVRTRFGSKTMKLGEDEDSSSIEIIDVKLPHEQFLKYCTPAYVDMVSEGLNQLKTARDISPKEKIGFIPKIKPYLDKNGYFYSFATRLAWFKDPKATEAYIARNNETEIINYFGNLDLKRKYPSPNSVAFCDALDIGNVMAGGVGPEAGFAPEAIKGKIIIMGYMGPDFDTYATEDKFFTPMNDKYIGRTDEDMFGVVVHANVVNMILKGKYIDQIGTIWYLVLNLSLISLLIIMFAFIYYKVELLWDGFTLIISVVLGLLFQIAVVFIFAKYDYKLDLTLATVALFLMPQVIELYFGLIQPLGMKLRNSLSKSGGSGQKGKESINLNK